jgi:hypothetical protein
VSHAGVALVRAAAVNASRRRAWAGIEARRGALPGVRIADKVQDGLSCLASGHVDRLARVRFLTLPRINGSCLGNLGLWAASQDQAYAGPGSVADRS